MDGYRPAAPEQAGAHTASQCLAEPQTGGQVVDLLAAIRRGSRLDDHLPAPRVIRPEEYTVLVLTGSGLKASAIVGKLLKLGPRSA